MLFTNRFFLSLVTVVASLNFASAQTISLSDVDFAAGERVIEISLEAGGNLTNFGIDISLPDTELSFVRCATFVDGSDNPPIDQNPFNQGCTIQNDQLVTFTFGANVIIPTPSVTGIYGVIELSNDIPSNDKTLTVTENVGNPCRNVATFPETPVNCLFNNATITAPVPSLSILEDSATISPTNPSATFTVQNTGNGSLELTTIDIPVGFSQSGGDCNLNGILAPAGSCQLILTFDGLTNASGTLTVSTTTANTMPSSDTASLTGIAPVPAIDIIEASGTISPTQPQATFTVQNIGDGDLEVSTIDLPTDFSQSGGTCSAGTTTLTPSSSCTIIVSFSGTTNATGTLTVTTTTTNASPSTDTADLSGIAPDAGVLGSISGPLAIMMMTGDQAVITLGNIANVGDSALQVTAVTLANGSSFSIIADNCSGATLQAGAPGATNSTCTITVELTGNPPVADDTLSASATDLTGAPLNSVDVTLTANTAGPIGIPTLSQMTMLVMALVLTALGMLSLRRQA